MELQASPHLAKLIGEAKTLLRAEHLLPNQQSLKSFRETIKAIVEAEIARLEDTKRRPEDRETRALALIRQCRYGGIPKDKDCDFWSLQDTLSKDTMLERIFKDIPTNPAFGMFTRKWIDAQVWCLRTPLRTEYEKREQADRVFGMQQEYGWPVTVWTDYYISQSGLSEADSLKAALELKRDAAEERRKQEAEEEARKQAGADAWNEAFRTLPQSMSREERNQIATCLRELALRSFDKAKEEARRQAFSNIEKRCLRTASERRPSARMRLILAEDNVSNRKRKLVHGVITDPGNDLGKPQEPLADSESRESDEIRRKRTRL